MAAAIKSRVFSVASIDVKETGSDPSGSKHVIFRDFFEENSKAE